MISAIVITADDACLPASPEAIVRSLGALVPAAIEGLIRDVTLAGPADQAGLQNIADHAGCDLVQAPGRAQIIASGLAAARLPVVLVLAAGWAPGAGFIEEIGDLMASGVLPSRTGLLRAGESRGLARFLPGLSPVSGLIASTAALNRSRAGSLAHLARDAGPRHILRCGARRIVELSAMRRA